MPGPSLILGAINPTGLAGKSAQCSSLERGVYSVSESQLTAVGVTRFATELRCANSPFKFCPGAPAPHKSKSIMSTGGRHTGVGFLSSCPTRAIRNGWNQEFFETGRCAAAQFHHHGTWFTGGVVYGWAAGSESNTVKSQTNELISHVFDQIRFHHGPKFLAGDFNQHPEVLPIHDVLIQHGRVEIQSLAEQKWGLIPSMTCKQTSRKDFIYVSPEIREWIRAVNVVLEPFPDHAVLTATLEVPGQPEPFPYWYKPDKISYGTGTHLVEALRSLEVAEPVVHQGSSTEIYAAIWKEHEHWVDNLMQTTHKSVCLSNQKGRGSTVARSFKRHQVSPIKAGRQGEPSPHYVGRSQKLKHWYTQWRRLINLERAMKSKTDSVHLHQHIQALWRSIYRAAGFSGSFANWWCTRSIVHPNAPIFIPEIIPPLAVVQAINLNFAAEVKSLDNHLHTSWTERIKAKHAANPNAVFQAVRDPGPVPVEVLLDQKTCIVTEVVDEGSVIVDSSASLDPQLPILCQGAYLRTEVISEDQIWFQSEHTATPGTKLTQQRPIGSLGEIFEAFEGEWSRRWDKHRELPESRWDAINSFIDSQVPGGNMQCSSITISQWDAIVRSKPSKSAVGMDGVHRDDLLHMPSHLKAQLLTLIDRVERSGEWPEQLLHGGVFSLEKRPGASQVHEFRPITILPTVYRIWSTIRSREMITFLSSFAPTHLFGNVKGRSSVNMWWAAQALAEQAMYDNQVAVGVIADLQKAFNTLPRAPLFRLAVKLGIPNRILRCWLLHAYQT